MAGEHSDRVRAARWLHLRCTDPCRADRPEPRRAGLAIGHEMAHVIPRTRDRPHQDRVEPEGAVRRLRGHARGTNRWPLGLRRVGIQWLEQAYSREQEFEADELGGRLMRAAGSDPHGCVPYAGALSPFGTRVRSAGPRRLPVDAPAGRRPHPPPARAACSWIPPVKRRNPSPSPEPSPMHERPHQIISRPDPGASPLSYEGRTRRRFARRLRLLGIPEDLTGWSVLDVGAWHGFFSFRVRAARSRPGAGGGQLRLGPLRHERVPGRARAPRLGR